MPIDLPDHPAGVPVNPAGVPDHSTKGQELDDQRGDATMTVPEDRLAAAIEAVEDPGLFHSVGDLGLLRSIRVRRRSTEVVLSIPGEAHPSPRELAEKVARAVEGAGGPTAEVELVHMSDGEQAELRSRLFELGRPASSAPGPGDAGGAGHGKGEGGHAGHRHEGATGGDRHGADGPVARTNPFTDKASRTRVIAISSGKGGVGKSSVTVNLAVALARSGASVALLDADVYGFSVPAMLGIDHPPTLIGDLLVPPVAHGVRCISMGFFVDEDQAVIWRGPMLHKALEQFLVDVHWGKPDYLLIDLPPGTGDVSMSVAQFLPRAEVLVVTTPQPAAERVAQRAAVLARQLRLPLRGVVENQSWFTGDDGKRYELFGAGGGEALSKALGVALLAKIPFIPALRQGGDDGMPIAASDPDGEAGRAFAELAERVVSMGPGRVYRSELAVR